MEGEACLSVRVRHVHLRLFDGASKRSPSNLFFLLLGELGRDPCRFLTFDEVFEAMEVVRGGLPVSTQEKDLFLDSDFWCEQRRQNASCLRPCRFEVVPVRVFTTVELRKLKRKVSEKATVTAIAAVEKRVSEAASAMMPIIGRSNTMQFYKKISLIAAEAPSDPSKRRRSSNFSVAGVRIRLFKVDKGSYKEALKSMSSQPWPVFGLTWGTPPFVLGGMEKCARDQVVTVTGIPVSLTIQDMTEKLRQLAQDELVGATVSFGRKSFKTGNVSMHILFSSKDKCRAFAALAPFACYDDGKVSEIVFSEISAHEKKKKKKKETAVANLETLS